MARDIGMTRFLFSLHKLVAPLGRVCDLAVTPMHKYMCNDFGIVPCKARVKRRTSHETN